MIHYHGTPITPRSELLTLAGRNFCVSYAHARDVRTCHEIGQSVMLDNGAFSLWRGGLLPDWDAYMDWVEPWLDYKTTWAVIPDVIGGDVDVNDGLLIAWFQRRLPGAPVWHLDEPLDRLRRLAHGYERVCFGSSGQYAVVGTDAWHRRVEKAFNTISDSDGRVATWVHMLRGMSLAGTHYPFSSVDSTDVAQNHNRSHNTALKLAQRWDGLQNPARWHHVYQLEVAL